MSEKPLITSFLSVFENKLDRQKKRLKQELDKARNDRNKEFIQRELKECKKLRDLIKKLKKDTGRTCPHCGGDL